jgi:hypothetical protein
MVSVVSLLWGCFMRLALARTSRIAPPTSRFCKHFRLSTVIHLLVHISHGKRIALAVNPWRHCCYWNSRSSPRTTSPWTTPNPALFRSKSKNSPFEDHPVQGRVLRTVFGGRTIHQAVG